MRYHKINFLEISGRLHVDVIICVRTALYRLLEEENVVEMFRV